MTRLRAAVILVVGVVAVAGGGWYAANVLAQGKPKDDSKQRTEVVKSAPFVVKIRETGTLEALLSVNVKSNVEGEIKQLLVHEGDLVIAGQPLIQLDDRQLREQKNQADAGLLAAQAQWEQAKRNVGLTDIQQNSALAEAEDSQRIAGAALEAAQRTTVQQLTSAQLEITSSGAALEQERIGVEQAKIALTQAELAADTAKSQQDSAKVSLTNAQAEVSRMRELYSKKFVSKSQLESAEASYASAKTAHEQAIKNVATRAEAVRSQEQALAAARSSLQNRESVLKYQRENLDTLERSREAFERQAELQLATADTRLKRVLDSVDPEKENSKSALTTAYSNLLRAQSTLKTVNEQLGWTRIVAPVSGTIIQLVVEEGEIVVSGRSGFAQGPAIMTIADLSQMITKAYIAEVDIPNVEVGQAAEIRTDAYDDKVFQGRVKEISPLAQVRPGESVTKFEVQVEVLGSPPELRPGMNVDVDIIVADRQSVAQLPIETLIEKQKVIVHATVPGGELSSLTRNQKVDVESRSGKRYPGRISRIEPASRRNVVVFIDDDAPKGLRAGEQVLTLVTLKEQEKKKPEDDRRIEDIPVLVESDRKQLVMVPDGDAPEEAKKPFWARLLPGPKKVDRPKGIETEIKAGLRNDVAFEVVSGLGVGDHVVIPELRDLVSSQRPGPGR